MRFTLVDRILEITPGEKIVAIKNLSMAEEYLGDHFPGFPVMPGVMMVEALTQASAWLIRASEDFANSIVTLKEAKNVKFANFLQPGQTLTITAEIIDQDERHTRIKASGTADGAATLAARLTMERYNLASERPDRQVADEVVIQNLREKFSLLYQPHTPVA